ncbi:hypothetical protein EV144_1011187 [Flavobacterium sp. 270]|uniref:hypothetical protein n=1 Tax=Flavobacterium sp. 270 TaxID=2512114 RepID=UPI001066D892|nr:hypothetical protein [Flavobacterium sp. 270]TDW52497.1 hypothetical protein EV144_1011187 [Flavobacterium sp. 270]
MRKVFFLERNLKLDYKMFYRFLLILIVSILSVSCNDYPADLKLKKKANDLRYDKLSVQADTSKTTNDFEKLLNDYTELSNDITSFNGDCQKRGIRSRDKHIHEVLKEIAHCKQVLATASRYDYDSSSTSSNSSSYSSSKTCSWCGKSFSGEHYTHLGKMSDCYRTNSTTSIGYYCSQKCCSEARKSSCPTCR